MMFVLEEKNYDFFYFFFFENRINLDLLCSIIDIFTFATHWKTSGINQRRIDTLHEYLFSSKRNGQIAYVYIVHLSVYSTYGCI